MKIAVTGASGHIGSNLCPLLIEKGHSLNVLVNKSRKGIPQVNTKIIEGSITNDGVVDTLIEGCDAVIHLAAKVSIEKDVNKEMQNVNQHGSENVINSCIKYRIKRLIYFSSIHTFNPFPLNEILDETRDLIHNHGSDYDRTKIGGELVLRKAQESGIETIVLCPTSVFGPNDFYPSLLGRAILDIYNRKIPAIIPAGYDFVDVRDIARGTLQALEKGMSGEKYILSGHYLTLKELSQKIGSIGGVKTAQMEIGIPILKLLLPYFKLESILKNKPPIFSKESIKILSESNPHISSNKAFEHFGYRKTSIDETIKATLNWFAEDGKIKFG